MTGRVALLAGGTGALGQSVTMRFLAEGAVACVPFAVAAERDALWNRVDPAAQKRLQFFETDVTDEASMGACVSKVLAAHGRIDALVNGVGGFAAGDLASTSLADWNRVMALNLTSAVIGCRAVLPAMTAAGAGRIVNIASRAVVPPLGGFIAYTVAKAGVITLTQAFAREVARGITVNAVLPSTMDTPGNRTAMPDADRSEWVSTEAVAEVIAYLASERAGMISGAAVQV
jgi:NAD(P)-dependent dehydrogenase (short-subunit alcohol dehydrogenase family)